MRRRTDWRGVVAMARSTPRQWRLHTTLVACDEQFYQHVRRRVPALQPSDGTFEFRKTNHGEDRLGQPVFDVFIRFIPREEPHGNHSEPARARS